MQDNLEYTTKAYPALLKYYTKLKQWNQCYLYVNPFNILWVVNWGGGGILVHVTYIDVHYNSKPRTFMNTSMTRYMRVTGTFPASATMYQFCITIVCAISKARNMTNFISR